MPRFTRACLNRSAPGLFNYTHRSCRSGTAAIYYTVGGATGCPRIRGTTPFSPFLSFSGIASRLL